MRRRQAPNVLDLNAFRFNAYATPAPPARLRLWLLAAAALALAGVSAGVFGGFWSG